ncbi:MAG: hypothetical protein AAB316_14715 [Bacteroidota bacterium]
MLNYVMQHRSEQENRYLETILTFNREKRYTFIADKEYAASLCKRYEVLVPDRSHVQNELLVSHEAFHVFKLSEVTLIPSLNWDEFDVAIKLNNLKKFDAEIRKILEKSAVTVNHIFDELNRLDKQGFDFNDWMGILQILAERKVAKATVSLALIAFLNRYRKGFLQPSWTWMFYNLFIAIRVRNEDEIWNELINQKKFDDEEKTFADDYDDLQFWSNFMQITAMEIGPHVRPQRWNSIGKSVQKVTQGIQSLKNWFTK